MCRRFLFNKMVAQNPGEAYAFFYCDAGKSEFERLLPAIRDSAESSFGLELSLTEGTDHINRDNELMHLAYNAEQSGSNYTIKAVDPSKTNEGAADELADVLNHAYVSRLCQPGESFIGEIVYKESGSYVSRE